VDTHSSRLLLFSRKDKGAHHIPTTAKSPIAGPASALPASVEESYRQKCKEIKKRIVEIENSNDLLTSRIQRARRAIQRMRLERAFLLEQLEKRTDARVADSEGSPSPPPTVRATLNYLLTKPTKLAEKNSQSHNNNNN
jgi:hypothetical protein